MTEVHDVARGFGAEAAAYDRARPSYPPDAVAWLVEQLRIRPGRTESGDLELFRHPPLPPPSIPGRTCPVRSQADVNCFI